jgi:hypothetical protein
MMKNVNIFQDYQGYSDHKKPFAQSKKMLRNSSYHIVIVAEALQSLRRHCNRCAGIVIVAEVIVIVAEDIVTAAEDIVTMTPPIVIVAEVIVTMAEVIVHAAEHIFFKVAGTL